MSSFQIYESETNVRAENVRVKAENLRLKAEIARLKGLVGEDVAAAESRALDQLLESAGPRQTVVQSHGSGPRAIIGAPGAGPPQAQGQGRVAGQSFTTNDGCAVVIGQAQGPNAQLNPTIARARGGSQPQRRAAPPRTFVPPTDIPMPVEPVGQAQEVDGDAADQRFSLLELDLG